MNTFFLDIRIENKIKNNIKGFLTEAWDIVPNTEFIIITDQPNIREAIEAVKYGAFSYLSYPVDIEEINYVFQSLLENMKIMSELDSLRDKFWQSDYLEILSTNSDKMRDVYKKVKLVAPTNSTIFISGETGTGKTILAKIIHKHSDRNSNAFVSVHCGAIPDTLIESELFGYEKGAFTGADKRKLGQFELANDGSIFLDEIGTLTPSAQIKLLKILTEKQLLRVGGEEPVPLDVRIIAASNEDLIDLCKKGLFRYDLYYRLNVFPLMLPSLRERAEDLPLLIDFFLKQLNDKYKKKIRGIHPKAIDILMKYSWPGNIRELENIIERAYILETSNVISFSSLPSEIILQENIKKEMSFPNSLSLKEVRSIEIEKIEKQYIQTLLLNCDGRINKAAEMAQVTTRQLFNLIRKYQLKKEDYK